MYYLIVFENGMSIVTAEPPATFVNSHVRMTQSHDEEYSAELAFNAYRLGREIGVSYANEGAPILKTEIDECKGAIAALNARIEGLHEYQAKLQARCNAIAQALTRMVSKLALQTVIERTHRERNKENAELIRDAHYWLEKPFGEYAPAEPGNNDDIPF
jgi:hypothetical protein